jgi:uncharacterized protein YndB with AHSA1/START domain
MRLPDGNELLHRGVYLEVRKNERLVFTDAYAKAWEPLQKPLMTVILTFEAEGCKTKYTARARQVSRLVSPRPAARAVQSPVANGLLPLTPVADSDGGIQ